MKPVVAMVVGYELSASFGKLTNAGCSGSLEDVNGTLAVWGGAITRWAMSTAVNLAAALQILASAK